MTEQNDRLGHARLGDARLARARAEIAERVASFKATQEKFERAREEYCDTTLENARNGFGSKASWS